MDLSAGASDLSLYSNDFRIVRRDGILTIVLYDNIEVYASGLARYLTQQNSDVRMSAFVSREDTETWCTLHPPDILLAAEELMEDWLLQLPAKRLVLLTEDLKDCVKKADGLPRIERYQSADDILSELLLIMAPVSAVRREGISEEKAAVFTAFYAPAPHPEHSMLAWQYAGRPSDGTRMLYIGLQENAGFCDRFQRGYRHDISDLLYLFMHQTQDFCLLLRSIICKNDGVTYVPPAELAADFFQVPDREWSTFLQALRYESGFDEIVFDLEFLFPAAFEILNLSRTVYLPPACSETETARFRHFREICRQRLGEEAVGRLMEMRAGCIQEA